MTTIPATRPIPRTVVDDVVVRTVGYDPNDPATLRVIAAALRGPAVAIEGEVA